MSFLVGVEGGATRTTVVVLDSRGVVLSQTSGGPSNHWHIGYNDCMKRIMELITEALNAARVQSKPRALGLALSGVDTPDCIYKFLHVCYHDYPEMAESFCIVNDTVGSIYTATPRGGISLISGTGSNCMLLTETGRQINCGGWGYLLGDQGSAYWISEKLIQTIINDSEGICKSQYSVERAKNVMMQHFSLSQLSDLLELFYRDFDVAQIASLCEPLSVLAFAGDELTRSLFYKAGRDLGRHVVAVLKKAGVEKPGDIVCTGSTWKSWDLLKDGFLAAMGSQADYRLLFLTKTAAIGAALHAGKNYKSDYAINDYRYEDNYDIIYP